MFQKRNKYTNSVYIRSEGQHNRSSNINCHQCIRVIGFVFGKYRKRWLPHQALVNRQAQAITKDNPQQGEKQSNLHINLRIFKLLTNITVNMDGTRLVGKERTNPRIHRTGSFAPTQSRLRSRRGTAKNARTLLRGPEKRFEPRKKYITSTYIRREGHPPPSSIYSVVNDKVKRFVYELEKTLPLRFALGKEPKLGEIFF